MTTKYLSFFITIFISLSCSTEPLGERKAYSRVVLNGFMDGVYTVDIKFMSDFYCYTERDGKKIYTDSCRDQRGVGFFSSSREAYEEAKNIVERSCQGMAEMVGQKSDQVYDGTTPVSCNSYQAYGTKSISTDCYGGENRYADIIRVFFRCNKLKEKMDINQENSYVLSERKNIPTKAEESEVENDVKALEKNSEKEDANFQKLFDK